MSNLPVELEPDDDDLELVEGPDPLTPREEVFVAAYSSPESATYSRATKSAEVAGYSQPHNAAWKLRRRPRIIAKIAEYQKEAMASVGRIFSDLENQRLLALAKGDIQAANRASELQGKHLAMFTDRVVLDEPPIMFDSALADQMSKLGMEVLERAYNASLEGPTPKLLEPKPEPEPKG